MAERVSTDPTGGDEPSFADDLMAPAPAGADDPPGDGAPTREAHHWRVADLVLDVVVRVANAPRALVLATVAVLIGGGLAYAVIEDKGPIEGAWWAIVTGFTVGYGDQYPVTTAGRGIGAFLIIAMFILALCLGAQITARLIEDRDEFTHEEQEELKAAIRELCAEQDRLVVMLETSLGHSVEQMADLDVLRAELAHLTALLAASPGALQAAGLNAASAESGTVDVDGAVPSSTPEGEK